MKHKLTKIISAVVAILMIATLIPVSALAEDIPQPKSGGVYDGRYYDQLLIDSGTFYVGQTFGLYCGPNNTNLNYYDYTWEIRHASNPGINMTDLEGHYGDAYLAPYTVDGVTCYRLSESPAGAIYAGPYMNASSPVAGTADIVCIWYDYYGNSYCVVNRLTFVEPASTVNSTLVLDAGMAEDVVSSANFNNIALTNLANVTATSGNEAVATVTNARIENGEVKYDINAVSAGSTRITVTYTGTAQMGPNLFGEYSNVTCTLTDTVDVTVNAPVVESNHYALTYDVNGADHPDTWTESIDTDAASYEFEIVTTIPTREGYTFKGWAETADATTAEYMGCDRITLTEAAPALTIYAVWEQNPVDPPVDPGKTSYPSLDKKIVLENGELVDIASVNKGDVVNFRLISNVPQDLLNYLEPDPVDDPIHNPTRDFSNPINGGKYELAFHDVMASELAFNEASVVVKIKDQVIPANLYQVVVNPEDGCTFEVLMDLVAIYKAVDENGVPYSFFTEDDFGTAEITVDYSATAADNLTAGEYLNEAWVEYEGGTSEHDTVKVYTCAVDVYKFDQAAHENGLAGAKFILGTVLNDDGTVGGIIDINGDGVIDENDVGITGEDGKIVFDGLKAGTYYLQETEAPEGYVCNSEVQTIVLDNTVANYTYTIDFANVLIPHTGGEGTLTFTIAGAAVIAVAVVAYVFSRRKNSEVVG